MSYVVFVLLVSFRPVWDCLNGPRTGLIPEGVHLFTEMTDPLIQRGNWLSVRLINLSFCRKFYLSSLISFEGCFYGNFRTTFFIEGPSLCLHWKRVYGQSSVYCSLQLIFRVFFVICVSDVEGYKKFPPQFFVYGYVRTNRCIT